MGEVRVLFPRGAPPDLALDAAVTLRCLHGMLPGKHFTLPARAREPKTTKADSGGATVAATDAGADTGV